MRTLALVLACSVCVGLVECAEISTRDLSQVGYADEPAGTLAQLLMALSPAAAFTPSSQAIRFAAPTRTNALMVDSEKAAFEQELSRRAVLAGAAALSFGALSKPASAGYWYDLGVEKLTPDKMEKDDDIAGSAEVKTATKSLLKLKKFTYEVKADLAKDRNMPATDINIFDVGEVKDILNKFSNQFEEESSRPTIDLWARQVTGDINSLKATTVGKPATRTDKQYFTVSSWVAKLDSDVAKVLSYANPKDLKAAVASITAEKSN